MLSPLKIIKMLFVSSVKWKIPKTNAGRDINLNVVTYFTADAFAIGVVVRIPSTVLYVATLNRRKKIDIALCATCGDIALKLMTTDNIV